MTNRLSDRINALKPSPTIAVSTKARALKNAGKDVVDFGIGEPDFDTPASIKAACIKALDDNQTHYPPVDGVAPLKTAIINKLQSENALSYEANQIIVSTGAKQSLYNLCQALLGPGDEVIIPAPYWVSYPSMVALAEATPVIINTRPDNLFKLNPAELETAITPNTKMLMLNSPSNPTGVLYQEADLLALAEVLRAHPDIIIVSDDIYEKILWEGETFFSLLNVAPDLYDRTVIVNGVSKAYAMTGWRIGYLAGPADIVAGTKKIQSQMTSGANSLAQFAAAEAISGDQKDVEAMRTAFEARYHYLFDRINAIPGFECIPTQGAFYLFPNITEAMAIKGVDSDIAFAERLLDEALIATVPGSAFGVPNHLRLSFAVDMHSLEDAIARFESFMQA